MITYQLFSNTDLLHQTEDNGVRRVGVSECLQQITGKTITGLLKQDIIRAARTLQT